jgi:hypothetical protein
MPPAKTALELVRGRILRPLRPRVNKQEERRKEKQRRRKKKGERGKEKEERRKEAWP